VEVCQPEPVIRPTPYRLISQAGLYRH